MDHISAWSDVDLRHLSRALICTSEDPFTWVDKTERRFHETLFERLKPLAPVDASEKNVWCVVGTLCSTKFWQDCRQFSKVLCVTTLNTVFKSYWDHQSRINFDFNFQMFGNEVGHEPWCSRLFTPGVEKPFSFQNTFPSSEVLWQWRQLKRCYTDV